MMMPSQFGIDIYREIGKQGFTIGPCMKELEKLAKSRGKKGMQARISLEIAKKNGLEIKESDDISADKAIINYAKAHKCAVATNDAKLIKILKTYGISVIRMKQKKYLMHEEA